MNKIPLKYTPNFRLFAWVIFGLGGLGPKKGPRPKAEKFLEMNHTEFESYQDRWGPYGRSSL